MVEPENGHKLEALQEKNIDERFKRIEEWQAAKDAFGSRLIGAVITIIIAAVVSYFVGVNLPT